MNSILSRYLKLLADKQPSCLSLSVLGLLSPDEAEAIDGRRLLPTGERIEAIASKAGCSPDEAMGIMQGYLYKFKEGLRFTPETNNPS